MRATYFAIFFLICSSSRLGAQSAQAAYVKMQEGDYGSALVLWSALIAREPEYAVAYLQRGYCKMMLGEYSSASGDYMEADAISQNLDAKAGVQWAYLAERKYADSIAWGLAALAIDPHNYWVKNRLAYAYDETGDEQTAETYYNSIAGEYGSRALSNEPVARLIPYYESVAFQGSRLKSSGFNAGVFALYNFDSGASFGAGYAQSNLGNPAATTPYLTHELKAMGSFLFSDLSSLTLTGHYLASNYAPLDAAATVSVAYKSRMYSRFTFGSDLLLFGDHKGVQATPQYGIPLSPQWRLNLGATGQVLSFAQVTNAYGALIASLAYCFSYFCASAGGAYGKLYTPLFENGAILVYIPDTLTATAFGRLAIKPINGVEISFAYSYSRWRSLNGDTPIANTFSFAAAGSLY